MKLFNTLSTVLKDSTTLEEVLQVIEQKALNQVECLIDNKVFEMLRLDTPMLEALKYAEVLSKTNEDTTEVKAAHAFFKAYKCHTVYGKTVEFMRSVSAETTVEQFSKLGYVKEHLPSVSTNICSIFKEEALVSDLVEYEDAAHKFHLLEYRNLLNNESKELSQEDNERFINADRRMEINSKYNY